MRTLRKSEIWTGLILMLALLTPPEVSGADTQSIDKKIIRGHDWAFGQSVDRKEMLWQRGVDGATMSKQTRPKSATIKKGLDSRTGIDNAIADSEKHTPRGKFDLSFQKEGSSWTVAPELKSTRPDEARNRESKHVLGAYAGIEATRDFNISVGPELILKDEESSTDTANPNQPDSALGLGMKFKLDF